MFDSTFIRSAINRSAANPLDRRRFIRAAGLTSAGVGAATLLSAPGASAAPAAAVAADSGAVSDGAILNFALNLEYLEAEFYYRATTGNGLPDNLTTGTGSRGSVSGGKKVPFKTKAIRQYAEEIAKDEGQHVAFLRAALGKSAVARPTIDLNTSFTGAAVAAGLIKQGETFDPYANEQNFLLAAFIFEDVGVTAYKGAAPLVTNKTYLGAAAGILAAEAYHAGLIRTSLYNMGLQVPAGKISDARDSLDGSSDLDQGITVDGGSNIVPLDENGIAFGRTPGQVLNIVYLNPKSVTEGGFFPDGVNGTLNTSEGAGSMPSGGAATGGGGTAPTAGASERTDTGLLVGGAAAAVGAVAAAGAYQRHRTQAAGDPAVGSSGGVAGV
ncbi:ferritin-like domain-containing protein [Terracoccus luteus]|uniref:Ferritin-like protein n=1 Tax=Terracoccus luteus TaxID=53356 RepID=A0A839Q0V5_9MICO|nr:ferritin-like domain-containing protein [Terracoccus luteus]MBB2986702.1 hypothetical protein [Terracoccus luteus]MCP2172353.1 hypothetical protein [Terracoccus luteus]